MSLLREANVSEKMEQMQSGEVINKIDGYECENSAVLHTAMRDFFDKRNDGERGKEATDLAYQELEKLKTFFRRSREARIH